MSTIILDFLPHLSIAQYRCIEDYESLIKHLEDIREIKIGSIRVKCIELVIAKLPIGGRFPELKVLEAFRLE